MQTGGHTQGMSDLQRFGQLIRETRQRRGLKSEELAQRIGVSKSVMSYIETARTKSMPEPELLTRLALALGLSKRTMLEALGYLDPADDNEHTIAVDAHDPRAALLALLHDQPDETVTMAIRLVSALVNHMPGEAIEISFPSHHKSDTA